MINMTETIKKLFCSFLAVVMLITMIPYSGITVYATDENGTCIETVLETEEESVMESDEEEMLDSIIPSVVVNESYDKYISLTLSITEDIVLPTSGKYYYEVDVVTHKADEVKEQTFIFEKEDSNSQNVSIDMNNGFLTEGETWTYDISVKLVQTKNEDIDLTIENDVLCSGSYVINDVEVIPYYEVKLTLENETSQIFTTQKSVKIAKIKFGKKTTAKDNMKVEDITYPGVDNSLALEFAKVESDLYIYASAGEDTALGKHTIRVTADAPEGMNAAQATVDVTVVQGIEEDMLSVYTPSNRLYKTENKNAVLLVSAQYTADKSTGANAKRKKVKWEILTEDKETITEESPLYGKIAISDGKITVNKKYVPSMIAAENRFLVKASANDFDGNTVCAYSEVIEITEEIMVAETVAIVQLDQDGNATVTARSESSITSDKLGQIRVFKEGAPVQEYYSNEELKEWSFEPEYLTYESSNAVVKISKDGTITATKPVANVKISATLNDKSKQKVSLKKLSIVYDKPEQIALKIEEIRSDDTTRQIGNVIAEDSDYTISSTQKTCLKVTLMKKDSSSEAWSEVNAYVNVGLNVTDGNIIRKNDGTSKQYYLLDMNKETIHIKLNDKANNRVITYRITNTQYPKGKAPVLSVKGNLKAASYDNVQTITYTLKKNGDFKYDSTGKSVQIAFDHSAMYKSEANLYRYHQFAEAMGKTEYKPVEDGKISLTFTTSTTKQLPAGNYKLWFTFGTYDGRTFLADTKAIAVTIAVKTVNLEKGSYQPVTAYNISMKEGGTVELKGTGKRFLKESVIFSNLKNANIDGTPNEFIKYFELYENTIKMKDNLSETELEYICKATNKADWKGYVDYSVLVGNSDGSYSKKMGTSKIVLTMKESIRKFTIGTVNAKDKKAVVKPVVYANNKKVNVIYAYAVKGNYTAEANGNHILTLTPKTGNKEPVGGANDVTIYLVPEGTYEANRVKLQELKQAWDNANGTSAEIAEAAFASAMKKYGIKANARVQLPVRNIDNREYAEKVIAIVNQERTAAGLRPLTLDEDVMYASFIRSKEIVKYFAHVRPDGRPCFTVLDDCGIQYGWAGENIAYGQPTPEAVMTAWMNSSGHRANILNENYTHMGVGCYESGGCYYWVQLFISKR